MTQLLEALRMITSGFARKLQVDEEIDRWVYMLYGSISEKFKIVEGKEIYAQITLVIANGLSGDDNGRGNKDK